MCDFQQGYDLHLLIEAVKIASLYIAVLLQASRSTRNGHLSNNIYQIYQLGTNIFACGKIVQLQTPYILSTQQSALQEQNCPEPTHSRQQYQVDLVRNIYLTTSRPTTINFYYPFVQKNIAKMMKEENAIIFVVTQFF